MKVVVGILFVLSLGFGLSGCGPQAFVEGDYDADVTSDNLLNDLWSETDMQNTVKDLVGSMLGHNSIAMARKPPLVMVTKLQNKTSEHIDTQNIMDMVRVELSKSGKIRFVNKEAREDIAEEYNYQGSGMVSKESKKGPGGQMAADYIIDGRLDSIVQEVGKKKTVYYKITLQLTNLQSAVIEWTDHKQIRKKYKKQTVGL